MLALSRVTSVQGLYIVTNDSNTKFYHGRRSSTSGTDLQAEFSRLRLNRLETIGRQMVEFISESPTTSIFTLNCQSLRKHAQDLQDEVVRKSSILVLSETWMQPKQPEIVPHFDHVVAFKRQQTRAGGVAIYRNSTDRTITGTPHMIINIRQTDTVTVSTFSIGDICSARFRLQNGQFIFVVAIYISPNKSVNDIIEFIHEILLSYTPAGATLLGKDWGSTPMILSGDFNINFGELSAQPLIDFLEKEFSLTLTSDRNIPTTKFGTTIDAVFTRFLENVESRIYISYFSYHKPIITILKSEETINTDE